MPRRASVDDRARGGRAPAGQHLTGRRVLRTIRRVELWSVFRLALFVYLAVYLLGLLTFVLLWWIASSTGTTGNIESFLRDVGFKGFSFNGPELFLGTALIGIALALTATLLSTVVAAMVNLISELTGGIQLVVIESPFGDGSETETSADAPRTSSARTVESERRATPDALSPTPVVTASSSFSRSASAGDDETGLVAPDTPHPHTGAGNGVAAGTGRWTDRALSLLRGNGSSVRTDPKQTRQ